MSEFWTTESIREHAAGVFLSRAPAPVQLGGVSIDSREIAPGQVFVALPGERVDGHDYLRSAHDAGASIAIVEREVEPPDGMTVIRVDDVRTSLARLAAAYRRSLRTTRVIAVTGSNGKTTTVRLIDHVLGSALRGSASRKSFNNDLGLPLTILNARTTDQYLVCETGMSSPGEIRSLAAIAAPDIGVITNAARAHLAQFGSVAAIAAEKASLLLELAPGSIAIVNADVPELIDAIPKGTQAIRFGVVDEAELRLTRVSASHAGVSFEINGHASFSMPLLGAHNAHNAAAAIAVARRLGLDDATIASALATARGPEMRLDRRTIAGIDMINDAYNANPDSMLAGVRAFVPATPDATRRVLVMGEMLELGADAPALHAEIGEEIARLIGLGEGPDAVMLVGESAAAAAQPLRAVLPAERLWLETETGDGRSIAERLAPGDAVLLKGSRAVGLERVVHVLESTAAASAH